MTLLPARPRRAFVSAMTAALLAVLGLAFHDRFLAPPVPARAATITVDTPTDEFGTGANCSLREAIQAANTNAAFGGCAGGAAGADIIDLPAGTYLLTRVGAGEDANATGDLDVVTDAGGVVLNGTGVTSATVVIDANGLDRALQAGTGIPVTLTNLTIQNGYFIGQGGGALLGGAATLSGTLFLNNTGGAGGGGVYITGTATLTNATFISNTVLPLGLGGGAYLTGAAVVNGGLFERNTGNRGGGLYTLNVLTLTGTVFYSNTTVNIGGGVEAESPAAVWLTNTTFVSNTAGGVGGGAALYGPTTVEGGLFERNFSIGGGGLYVWSTLTLTGTAFYSNTTSGGGSGLSAISTTVLINTTFISNTAGGAGGGAFLGGAATVSGGTFERNTTLSAGLGHGGGLYADTALTLTGTSFYSNTARASGGGLYTYNAMAAVSLTDPTFAGNTAQTSSGGGAYFSGPTTIYGGRFTGNTAPRTAYGYGGGGLGSSGELVLTGTAFYSNTAGGWGGGLFSFAAVVLTNTTFISNTAQNNGGGGAYIANMTTVSGGWFERNTVLSTTAGYAGSGGGLFAGSSLDLTGTTFYSNTAGYGAGGLYAFYTTVITNATFINNTAAGRGGGAQFNNVTTLTGGTFQRNTVLSPTAGYGGGLYAANTLALTGTTFYSNTAGNAGGGAYITNTTTAALSNAYFETNRSGSGGGGLYASTALVLTQTQFLTNTAAGGDGGGLFSNKALTLTAGLFQGNGSMNGGALFGNQTLALSGTQFLGNHAEGPAGALYAAGAAAVTNGRFEDNHSLGNGGAVYAVTTLALTNTQLITNTGDIGGAVYATGVVRVTGGAFENNLGNTAGGGLRASGALTISGTQFISNTVSAGAGGGAWTNATLTLTNTQFISNTAGAGFGGGAYAAGAVTANLGYFERNSTTTAGGGLYTAGTAALTDTQFLTNTSANQGGGLWAGQAVTLVGGLIADNQSLFEGGGLYVNAAVNATDAQFVRNTSGAHGGAVYAMNLAGAVSLNRSQFISNTASMWGGGVLAVGGMTLTATHFLSNTAFTGGGAYANGQLLVTSSYFTANVTVADGGGLIVNKPTVISDTAFVNNIVTGAGNAAGGLAAQNSLTLVGGVIQGNTCPAPCVSNGLQAQKTLTLTGSLPYTYTDDVELYTDLVIPNPITFTAGTVTFSNNATTHTVTATAPLAFNNLVVVTNTRVVVGGAVITVTSAVTNAGSLERLTPAQPITLGADTVFTDGVGALTAIVNQSAGAPLGNTTLRVSAHITPSLMTCGTRAPTGATVRRYFGFTPVNTASVTADLTLIYYAGPAFSEAADLSEAGIYQCLNGSWQPLTATTTTGTSGNYAWMKLSGYTFSSFTAFIITSPSHNAALTNLKLSTGALTPVFAASTFNYTQSVASTVVSVVLTPTVSDANATVQIRGVSVASGSPSSPIPLNAGANVITTVVTAQDGVTTQTYTATVTRAAASNAGLLNLKLSTGALTPAFTTNTQTYTQSVASTVASVVLTPTLSDAKATVQIRGVSVTSGTATSPITLSTGANVITTVVTAEDGFTTRTYTVTLTRPASSNAALTDLVLSTGPLTPAFAAGTASYTQSVAYAVTSVVVTPTAAGPNATLKVRGVPVVSGSATNPIPLTIGANVITTVVTAEDGFTTQTYTVTVFRPTSTDATLSNLVVSTGPLNPAFDPAVTAYTQSVASAVFRVVVTPTTNVVGAAVTVNDAGLALGADATLILLPGPNLITVTVVAPDEVTVKTYTLTITRAPLPTDGPPPAAGLYLPLLMRNFVYAPDLIVQSLRAGPDTVQVVIKNQGAAPVLDEFWVDVYLNPSVPPSGGAQYWQGRGETGLVWGVTQAALPQLAPGGVLTLTVNDAYYDPTYTRVTWPLPAGMPVYAQVDAISLIDPNGGVLENHEITGGPYNNLFGPVAVTK